MPITRRITSAISRSLTSAVTEGGGGFYPGTMFAAGEQGAWYVPREMRLSYQGSDGTSPVSIFTNTVGLRLDKKNGLQVGTEQVTNGDFASGTTGWAPITANATLSIVNGKLRVTAVAAGTFGVDGVLAATLGQHEFARATVDITSSTASAIFAAFGGGPTVQRSTPYGTVSRGGGSATVRFNANPGAAAGGEYFELALVSVKKVAGSHSYQLTSTLRPLYAAGCKVDFDGVDDALVTTFSSSLGSNCTIARAVPGTGAVIQTGQVIGTTFTDSTDSAETIVINRALTDAETAQLTNYLNAVSAGSTYPTVPGARLTLFGDSLTASTTGVSAVTKVTGIPTLNRGVSGEGSADIAIRQGGLKPAITVTGDTIPASGAVSVTAISPATGYRVGVAFSFVGTLAGIPGTLARDAAGAWTFTRTSGGSATGCPAGTQFIADQGPQSENDVQSIWVGRNNVSDATFLTDTPAMVALMVANLKPAEKRYVVISVTNATSEGVGTSGYNKIVSHNATLAATYGGYYYDLRTDFIQNGLTVAGIAPTASDLEAIADDRPPPSLMADAVHPNAAGYEAQRDLFAAWLLAKGWFL